MNPAHKAASGTISIQPGDKAQPPVVPVKSGTQLAPGQPDPLKPLAAKRVDRAQPSRFEGPLKDIYSVVQSKSDLPDVLAGLVTDYLTEQDIPFEERAADLLNIAMRGSEGIEVAKNLDRCLVPVPGREPDMALDLTLMNWKAHEAVRGCLSDSRFTRLLASRVKERGGRSLEVIWSPNEFHGKKLEVPTGATSMRLEPPTPERLEALKRRIMLVGRMGARNAAVVASSLVRGVHVSKSGLFYVTIDATSAVKQSAARAGSRAAIQAFDTLLHDPEVIGELQKLATPRFFDPDLTIVRVRSFISPPNWLDHKAAVPPHAPG